MISAVAVERLILAIYWLSPYAWIDALLARFEKRGDIDRWRARRYLASELYIALWLLGALLLWLGNGGLVAWLIWPALLRVVGILTKELGVILFGRCKVTPGRMVAATGRTIVLALENYFTAALLMAFVYTQAGVFDGAPATADAQLGTGAALIQSLSIQFALTPAFTPADLLSWSLVIFHAGFAFLFSLIVISLFVSLLKIGSADQK